MMFEYCQRAGMALKVAGPTRIQIPDQVEYLGLISEEEKEELLAKCRAVIVPSAMESLSIAALEAWSHGKPVIAWEKSTVLTGQISRSGGGYSFGDFEGFLRITKSLDAKRGLRGWEFVKQNHGWDMILPRYEQVFEEVARHSRRIKR
jgi:glycosyltransferase involved in cell wall biosynthesis